MYRIAEAETYSASAIAAIHLFNSFAPEIFPPLKPHHLNNGFWWFAYCDGEVVGFAGMVPNEPHQNEGYAKRAYVLPDHRGHGLQQRFLALRCAKAKEIGWTQLVSECGQNNKRSAHNFRLAGFVEVEPEQPWGAPGSIYWVKTL